MVNKCKLALVAWVLVVACLVGCERPPEAVISPDGQTVTITTPAGLRLHDTSGATNDFRMKLKDANSPSVSPDGKWVLVGAGKESLLIDRMTGHRSTLAGLEPPFAWRPDGTEVVGNGNSGATVVYVHARSVVRTYPIGENFGWAVWMGAGRDLVLGGMHSLIRIHDGMVTRYPVKGDLMSLAVDSVHGRILWAAILDDGDRRKPPHVQVELKAIDFEFQQEETLMSRSSFNKLFHPDGLDGFPWQIVISPDGEKLGLGLMVDASEPGLVAKYAALGGFDLRMYPQEAIEKKLESLGERIRVRTELLSISIRDRGVSPMMLYSNVTQVSKNRHPGNVLEVQAFLSSWSQDSKSIAVVDGDKVLIRHV